MKTSTMTLFFLFALTISAAGVVITSLLAVLGDDTFYLFMIFVATTITLLGLAIAIELNKKKVLPIADYSNMLVFERYHVQYGKITVITHPTWKAPIAVKGHRLIPAILQDLKILDQFQLAAIGDNHFQLAGIQCDIQRNNNQCLRQIEFVA